MFRGKWFNAERPGKSWQEQLYLWLNYLDAVTLIFVMSAIHPDKMADVAAKIFRYLKPGGQVFFRWILLGAVCMRIRSYMFEETSWNVRLIKDSAVLTVIGLMPLPNPQKVDNSVSCFLGTMGDMTWLSYGSRKEGVSR